VRLVHLTDPHLTKPPDWRTLAGRSHLGKRYLGYASWVRKRRKLLRREWLDELIGEIESLEPDRLLITGDLTQIGTAEEIAEAGGWLESLGDPDRVCFVPGNHDTYAGESWSNLLGCWSEYLPGGSGSYPTVKQQDGITVIGLTSAVPTRPLSACGLLGSSQLAALEAVLEAQTDTFTILLLHHPPLPGMEKFRKRLRDAAALESLVERYPVNLVLHGHQHRNRSAERHGVKVFCTAPASAENASFRVFDVNREEDGWRVAATLKQRTSTGFESADYSSWHFAR
jgi:3',5'-cyclic AMP phosphodiesterase CpdA